MSEGQEREKSGRPGGAWWGGCRLGWDAVDEGFRSWVGGPSVLRKGRFHVTINLVCKGGLKTVGAFLGL